MGRKSKTSDESTPENGESTYPVAPGSILTEEEKAARMANRRVMFLCRVDEDGIPRQIIRGFANKYRLRKWYDVAKDLDQTLISGTVILYGRLRSTEEVLNG